ncbi:hypothetical protein EMPS_03581 [Entomortierella parvispora]|uniref:Ion transport domain-containing protein n=1 Tax=Entomortierella parvispora TaxID=205924 RepID=A0A9P3LUJ7_9FUNG|nr:hypothetical protein EMPS_03581 [Entomortierella parvispora]
MSSTDPPEEHKRKWSPLSVFGKGGNPPPQQASEGPAAMAVSWDQMLPAQTQPAPASYSMFVDRNQPLPPKTYSLADCGGQAPMYPSRDERLQYVQATMPDDNARPASELRTGYTGDPGAYPPTTFYPPTLPTNREDLLESQAPMFPSRDERLQPIIVLPNLQSENTGNPSAYPPTTQSFPALKVEYEYLKSDMFIDRDRPLELTVKQVDNLGISSSTVDGDQGPISSTPSKDADNRILETKDAGANAEIAPKVDPPDMDPETAAAVAAIRAMQAMPDQSLNPFAHHTLMTVHRDHVLPLPSKTKEQGEDQEVPLLVSASGPVTPIKPASTSVPNPPLSSSSSKLSSVGENNRSRLHVDRDTPLVTSVHPEMSAMRVDRDTPLPRPTQPIITPPQSYPGPMAVNRDTPLPSRTSQSQQGAMRIDRDTPLPRPTQPIVTPPQSHSGPMAVNRDTPLPSMPPQSQQGVMRVDRDTLLPRPPITPSESTSGQMHVERDTLLPGGMSPMHVDRDTLLPIGMSPMHVDRDTTLPVTETPAVTTGWTPYPARFGFPNFPYVAGGDKIDKAGPIDTPAEGQDVPQEEAGNNSNSGGANTAFTGYNPMMYPAHLMNNLQHHPPYMRPIIEPDPTNTVQPMIPPPLVLQTPQKNALGAPEKIDGKTADAYRWKVQQYTQSATMYAWQTLALYRGKSHYECTLDISAVEGGWYWIVFHMELSQFLRRQMMDSLVIDVKQLDWDGKEIYMSKTCKTELTDLDFNNMFASRLGVPIRVRLHRQIELHQGKDLQVTIDSSIQSAVGDYLKVLHIDIVRGEADNSDVVAYGEGRPQEVIHIPQHHTHGSSLRTTNVHFCSLSESRNHAVTLSFANDRAYLHVWDLSSSGPDGPSTIIPENPRSPTDHRVPFAQTSFDARAANHEEIKDICLGISSTGMQVAIHSIEPDNGQGIPFKLFQYASKVPADHDMSTPWSLVNVDTLGVGLKDFFGYGCFHTLSGEESAKEKYVTCEGTQVRVYSTIAHGGRWELHFTLPLCLEQNLDAALRLYASIYGRYFAWTGSKDVVSIWDIDTGRHVSYIATLTEDDAEVCANFSRSSKKVAISVSGKIRIHQTHSGVLLGEYTQGLDEDCFYEVDFDEDYFMTIDQTASTAAKERQESLTSCRRIVDTRSDMTIQRTYWIHRDYRLQGITGTKQPLFGYGQGSVFNLFLLPDPIAPAPSYSDHPSCDLRGIVVDRYVGVVSLGFLSHAGDSFQVSSSQRAIRGIWSTVLEISRSTDFSKSVILPLGPAMSTYHGVFVAETSHLVLVVGCFLQRWKLLATGPEICALELIWKIQDDSKHLKDICIREIMSAGICRQGQEVILQLAPPQWFRRYRRIEEEDEEEEDEKKSRQPRQPRQLIPEIATVPLSQHDTVALSLEDREIQGVVGAVTLYSEGDVVLKRYVIEYLKSLVRLSQEHTFSCVVSLARVWTPERRSSVEGILSELLSSKRVTWVPDTFATKENDPLSILMGIAKRQPSAIGASRIILDYCVEHAVNYRNLSFLSPLFLSLHSLMNLFPEEASEYLSKIAFIPAQQRSFIIDNHQVARPPRMFRIPFWKTSSVPLYKVEDPILQLVVTPPKEKDAANDTFTRPVFMTSFDALFTYMDNDTGSRSDVVDSDAPSNILRAATVYSPVGNGPNTVVLEDDNSWIEKDSLGRKRTNWFKIWLHMVRYKSKFRSKIFVKSHDFNLEFFDNPAIAALVAYKWNTIGYSYWFFRFMSQCVFYFFVYFAALFQVYDRGNPNPTIWHFIVILILGAGFLWLELLQAIRNWHRYRKSSYNMLDLVAYGLPMIASIDQIVIHQMDMVHGNTRILSFSVIIVFLHMLFEARVNEGICKYVTIIQEAILEIKVFLVIFAAGLFGFAVAILHLLHGGYPMGDYVDSGPNVDNNTFPMNFAGALSATYFFMGGIYDPISANFDGEDWAFHIMMALFFFFTVILMLNVLIALINVAFIKGGDGWRLVWIESRLQYIESAENMSYHLPGFRDAHDEYFPKVVYFTATWKEVKDYKQKYEEEKQEGAAAAEATKQLNERVEACDAVAHGHGHSHAAAAPETPGGGAVGNGGASEATLAGILAQLEALKLIILETQKANNAGGAVANTPSA